MKRIDRYTPEMLRWIRRHYEQQPLADTARLFETEFGLPVTPKMLAAVNIAMKWEIHAPPAEWKVLRWLKRNYVKRTLPETRLVMNRKFGLCASMRDMKKYRSFLGLKGRPKSGFSKGHVPANKGVKMSPEKYRKCKATMFRKGNVSATVLDMFTIRVRNEGKSAAHKVIKIPDPGRRHGKWVIYSRWLWEQEHGPIPDGGIVVHVNGDPLDCRLDNLRLVDRKVLMIMNHYKSPDPVGDADTDSLRISLAELESVRCR